MGTSMTSETRGENCIRGLDPGQCQQRGKGGVLGRPHVLAFLGNLSRLIDACQQFLAGDAVLDRFKA